jgi:hypothetical protein
MIKKRGIDKMDLDYHKNGIVWFPYVSIIVKTSINGETVWYKNKWKNLLLKIKYFFVKPKYLKNVNFYKNKPVNNSYYTTFNINNEDSSIITLSDEFIIKIMNKNEIT